MPALPGYVETLQNGSSRSIVGGSRTKGRATLRAIQTAQRARADGLGAVIGGADLKKANDAIARVFGAVETRAAAR
jgi:hypothetical protein